MVHSYFHVLVTRADQIGVPPPRVYMKEHQKPSEHGTWLLFSVNNECGSIEFYKPIQYFLTTSQVVQLKIYLPLHHLEFTLKSGFMPHRHLSAKTNHRASFIPEIKILKEVNPKPSSTQSI